MLNLKSSTSPQWLEQVENHLDDVLVDHAHCEKKAAGTAMSLIFAYGQHVALCRELSAIVVEELEHFGMVLDLLESRSIKFQPQRPSNYGKLLNDLVRKGEPLRALDRLLVAGLIEARSCERFAVLRDGLQDRNLASFYGSLFESEARHHSTYVRLANHFATETEVHCRVEELAFAEAKIIDRAGEPPRVHS